ncbi:hypothetical protein GE061_005838 [Apolygus lucorum]|uniref:Uncharacterized protein n=1 Tax=Apolygus lucorum TaxID=248454 RepID=A0A8S9WWU3_APOLU|nr:hypothetical protein GE061_005838 [Apolygus lucorum]
MRGTLAINSSGWAKIQRCTELILVKLKSSNQHFRHKIRVMKLAAVILLSLAQLSIQSSKFRRDTLFGLPLDQPYFPRQQASQYPTSGRDIYPQNYGGSPGYVQFPDMLPGLDTQQGILLHLLQLEPTTIMDKE